METGFWQKWAYLTLSLAGAAAALYLILKYALPFLLPFLIAFALAALTRPLVQKLARRLGGHERTAAIGVTAFFLCLFGLVCCLLIAILVSQLQNFLEFILLDAADENGTLAGIFAFFRDFSAHLPFLSRLFEAPLFREMFGDFDTWCKETFTGSVVAWGEKIPSFLTGVAGRLPSVLLFLLVTLISCFFAAADYAGLSAFLRRLLPSRVLGKLPEWRRRISVGVRRYLKAYLLLFLLTFGELFLGLTLLREKYAFLIAGITALLDIFPVLGVGTVLLPWALFRLFTGNTAGGIWLLLLYAVITVVRQIAEPHLVGKSIGLHPLLTLISFYVGMKIFGFIGIFIGPVTALAVKAFFFSGNNEIAENNETPAP